VIWSALTMMACLWTTRVRMQRADLMADEEQAKRQARLDPLTALGNRRAFDERLDRAVDAARLNEQPLSVIVADLDDFKEINDSFGHLNGDEILRTAAAAMRAAVRDADACYRWGGDEFAVLLPGVEQDVAEKVAERVSASIVASCIRPGGDPQTLAWGTAELAPEMQASDLLASADLALMTRKHKRSSGRFRAGLPESESN
jgi:diguanylate cyclase (GGDEF)-like protein